MLEPMRRLKRYGPKRLKAALRAKGQLGDGTINYRQSVNDDSYRYKGGERVPKRQKSWHDEIQKKRGQEESISRSESALSDITERARN